ncbi:hypothetical protein Q7P37_006041 [Cladosporium fusiforme]
MPSNAFNPYTEIPSLTGKVIFITGGTAGLGRETILNLAAHSPAHIYFSGRSQTSADALIATLKTTHPSQPITFVQTDLASLESVKSAAKAFLATSQRLDILFANAGVMCLPPGLTKEGYEIQFGTNHLGHAALVNLLLPTMESTAKAGNDVRIVWNTSLGHKMVPSIPFATLKTPQDNCSPFFVLSDWVRYAQSKLANLLYAREIAKRHPLISSVSIHPGVSFTGLVTGLGWFNRFFVWLTTLGMRVSVEECAWNQLWAAAAPLGKGERMVVSGRYYEPVGVEGSLTKAAGDEELAAELWEWTQKELEQYGI